MAAACIRLRPSLLHTVSRRPFRQASEAILTNRVTKSIRMRTRAQEQAALRQRAYRRLGVALVLLLILGLAGFRHSTRAMSLSKESLDGAPAYVEGPTNQPAVIAGQEWCGSTQSLQCTSVSGCMLRKRRICTAGLLSASAPCVDCDFIGPCCSLSSYCCLCDKHRLCRWGVTDEIKGQAEHLS